MRADKNTGPAALEQLVFFEQSVGGPERGEIVRRALGALIKGKNTGTLEGDVMMEYVRCCWDRGSRFGGMGGQDQGDSDDDAGDDDDDDLPDLEPAGN